MQTTIVTFCPTLTFMTGQFFEGTPWSTLSLKPSWLAIIRNPPAGFTQPAGRDELDVLVDTLLRSGRTMAMIPKFATIMRPAARRSNLLFTIRFILLVEKGSYED